MTREAICRTMANLGKRRRYTLFCRKARLTDPKPVDFCGSFLDDLRAFPLSARSEAGHQLDPVQHGQEPDDWKPMNTMGKA